MSIYAPAIVPQETQRLGAFLTTELERIAQALSDSVKLAFGGLIQTTALVSIPLTPAPITWNPYDQILPATTIAQGIEVDVAAGSLTILTGGIYSLFFFVTLDPIGLNAEFTWQTLVNGVPGILSVVIDPSNQSSRETVTLAGIVQFERGDVLTLEASSSTSDTANSVSGSFFASRISDSFD